MLPRPVVAAAAVGLASLLVALARAGEPPKGVKLPLDPFAAAEKGDWVALKGRVRVEKDWKDTAVGVRVESVGDKELELVSWGGCGCATQHPWTRKVACPRKGTTSNALLDLFYDLMNGAVNGGCQQSIDHQIFGMPGGHEPRAGWDPGLVEKGKTGEVKRKLGDKSIKCRELELGFPAEAPGGLVLGSAASLKFKRSFRSIKLCLTNAWKGVGVVGFDFEWSGKVELEVAGYGKADGKVEWGKTPKDAGVAEK